MTPNLTPQSNSSKEWGSDNRLSTLSLAFSRFQPTEDPFNMSKKCFWNPKKINGSIVANHTTQTIETKSWIDVQFTHSEGKTLFDRRLSNTLYSMHTFYAINILKMVIIINDDGGTVANRITDGYFEYCFPLSATVEKKKKL